MQSCSIQNNIGVIFSKFINKFVDKCQCYYTLLDQSIPLVTVTSDVSLLTEQLWTPMYLVPVKSKVKISQNFVAISDYLNFKTNGAINWELPINFDAKIVKAFCNYESTNFSRNWDGLLILNYVPLININHKILKIIWWVRYMQLSSRLVTD